MLTIAAEGCVAGVDVGSTLTKVVVANGRVLATATGRTAVDYIRGAARLLAEALGRSGGPSARLRYVVATGYGRRRLPFADRDVTEITCHARGVREVCPGARTIIDIGGQDAKGIKLGATGKVVDFAMNEKCAAGTGRFLEVTAASLGLSLDELGRRSLAGTSPASISSVCTVFAEQEVAQRLAEGTPVEDVLAGLLAALASRVHRMVRGLGIEPEVVLTGGVARNAGLVRALAERLGVPVTTPPDPLLTGALGAAALAAEAAERGEVGAGGPARAEFVAGAVDAPEDTAEETVRRRVFSAHAGARPYALEGSFPLAPGGTPPASPAGGIDAGALFTKAVVVRDGEAGFAVLRSEGNYRDVAERALERAAARAGTSVGRLATLAATGLGVAKLGGSTGTEAHGLGNSSERDIEARHGFAGACRAPGGLGGPPGPPIFPDVTSLGAGIARLLPDVTEVIDIGGHGTRVVQLAPGGTVRDFVLSGQCAAGSARILEVIAHLLGVDVDRLGALSLAAREPARFAAGCAVFAETEAISLLTRGTSAADLAAGLHRAMAQKIVAMARVERGGTVAVAGGGGRDAGLVAQLAAALPGLAVPPEPLVVAALGAALLGAAGPAGAR